MNVNFLSQTHSAFWVYIALLRRRRCENDSILFKFFTAFMFHLFSSCLKCLYRQVLIPNKPFHLSSSFHLVFCVMARQRALSDRLGWLTLIRPELSSYQRENCINNITSLRIEMIQRGYIRPRSVLVIFATCVINLWRKNSGKSNFDCPWTLNNQIMSKKKLLKETVRYLIIKLNAPFALTLC